MDAAPLTGLDVAEDSLKWVAFARRVFWLVLGLVVLAAGVSGVVSTRLADQLLRDSLETQGRSVSDALARAAFVPLSLEDAEALRVLVDSYRGVENVAALRVRDANGRVVAEQAFGVQPVHPVVVRAPVRATAAGSRPVSAVGSVEASLSSARVDALSLRIAWLNLWISGMLVLSAALAGFFLVRRLVERMRRLVDEARLVAQIRQANADLEAFSYSVSHDLRAPLRGVMGFAQLLRKRYDPKLDEVGRDYLARVETGSKRMAEIIEDLISLSRVARQPLRRQRVDVSALAETILAQLREREPARRVDTVVRPGLVVEADPGLLRLALENLLGNAWKYTARAEAARVELGESEAGGRRELFVRDNGAGFDMAYASKLFKPFQRLHSASEFEGTGIGLATVERILRRHGGSIRAEAAPGRGAAFYFTLEDEP